MERCRKRAQIVGGVTQTDEYGCVSGGEEDLARFNDCQGIENRVDSGEQIFDTIRAGPDNKDKILLMRYTLINGD
jgi:hypothetical protein